MAEELLNVVLGLPYAAHTWPQWAPPHKGKPPDAYPRSGIFNTSCSGISKRQRRRGAPADWLFPPYLTHRWVNSSVTSESGLRGVCGYCACTAFVCVWGGGNTVRRRWIESPFIHHCDSWSRSNTTFQVTSWSHFWRVSCEGYGSP